MHADTQPSRICVSTSSLQSRVSAYPLSKNPLNNTNNSYCVPAILLVIHLKQLINNTACLFDVLKDTEGKKKKKKRIKGITAYPGIQLFQGYSFEGAGYSAITHNDQSNSIQIQSRQVANYSSC